MPPEEIVKGLVEVADFVRGHVESGSGSISVRHIRSLLMVANILEPIRLWSLSREANRDDPTWWKVGV
ncbi:hypothetical protein A3K71_00020 [archaeon RBG_16_50_20]|nr:MAG: hypothetical protein A3K71_00020 [archaeon RBG_16_50_20]